MLCQLQSLRTLRSAHKLQMSWAFLSFSAPGSCATPHNYHSNSVLSGLRGIASSPQTLLAISLADADTDRSDPLNVCAIAEAAGRHLVLVSNQLSLAHYEGIPQRVCNVACLHRNRIS